MNCFLLPCDKRIYFASDLHLTAWSDELSRRREQDFVQWLDTIKSDAAAVFLLGDIFDFWFEYKQTVPRGFVRLLGKLAELTDSGISVIFFTGNHDQWLRNYLTEELNISIYRKPAEFEINEKRFLIGHGHDVSFSQEGLYIRARHWIFENKILRALFASLNPRWGLAFGKNWSISHRKRRGISKPFEGLEKELIYRYVQKVLVEKHYDFFVFGHRHLAIDVSLNENSRYINTGEWLKSQSYAVFDGKDMQLINEL